MLNQLIVFLLGAPLILALWFAVYLVVLCVSVVCIKIVIALATYFSIDPWMLLVASIGGAISSSIGNIKK